ncbi:zinc ribbon domain-containing protein [Paramicrobacterium fandaimingii]|uniref:zinc ribbon domain-containing protein n=1 Tax=Paramicrobacterium fandaimingii TaxID=2708079 RepID=UPI00141F0EC5|nr:C4-type zinc ribbon domain-containing protein [Microbacterium fandaimingii]
MKAPNAEQKKLLELQQTDSSLDRLMHREKNLPESALLQEAAAERDGIVSRLATEVGAVEDAEADLGRLESDAATVSARMQRDDKRLQQTSSVKDVTALESELESLRGRTAVLEEQQLDVMQTVEDARGVADATRAEGVEIDARIADIRAQRQTALDDIAEQRGTLAGTRHVLTEKLDAELLEAYEKQRAKTGIGAALFRAGTCGGCTMSLTGQDLATIRAAALDDVVRCPECNCIVVRTEESGLW